MGKTEGNLYYQMRMYIYGDNQILFIFKKKKILYKFFMHLEEDNFYMPI